MNAVRLFIATCLAVGFLLSSSMAFAGATGLGLILLSPTGVSLNKYVGPQRSIDAAMAWSLNDDDQSLYAHTTYLLHQKGFFEIDKTKIDTYYGGGLRLISWDNPPGKKTKSETHLGLRGVGGVAYIFRSSRIQIFSEVSLTMDVVPDTDADLGVGLGARYYFK